MVFALLLAGVGIFWALSQATKTPARPEERELTAVIPWADLAAPEPAGLPEWTADPTAYRGEFEDILDRLALVDPDFVDEFEATGHAAWAETEENR